MNKIVGFIGVVIAMGAVAVAGQFAMNAITANNTFAGWDIGNVTYWQWLPALTRSWWFVFPIALLVILFIRLMKPAEPQMPNFGPPRMPRQRKPTKAEMKQQQKPPNIFFGGR
jgi:hypothetical protein